MSDRLSIDGYHRRCQPVGGPTRPDPPPRAPHHPSASYDAPPHKGARPPGTGTRPGAAVAGHRPPVRRGSRTGHRYEPARDRGTRGAGASGGVAAVATPTTVASATAGLSRYRHRGYAFVRAPSGLPVKFVSPAWVRNVRVVSGSGADGVWSAGERVELEVRYSLPVVVEQPEDCWSYNDDGTCRDAGPYVLVAFRSDARPGYGKVLSTPLVPYVGGSGTDTLRFAYTVGAAEAGAKGVGLTLHQSTGGTQYCPRTRSTPSDGLILRWTLAGSRCS